MLESCPSANNPWQLPFYPQNAAVTVVTGSFRALPNVYMARKIHVFDGKFVVENVNSFYMKEICRKIL